MLEMGIGGRQFEPRAYSVSLISSGRMSAQACSTFTARARPAGLPMTLRRSLRGESGGDGVCAMDTRIAKIDDGTRPVFMLLAQADKRTEHASTETSAENTSY